MHTSSLRIFRSFFGLALLLAVLLGWSNSQAQIIDIYSSSVQGDLLNLVGTGWVQGPNGWTYTVIDTDGDPNEPDEASEGEGYSLGPFPTPDNTLAGILPQPGDPGATNAQPYNFANDQTSGGPIDLATGAETFSHTLLTLSGARSLEFTISYNSQITAGNQYVATPIGGGNPYWSLYTPGDIGHWTHNFDGQAAAFVGVGGAASKVIILVSHRRWTFLQSGTKYTTFDQSAAYDSLVLNADGSYTLTTRDQTAYTFSGPGLYLTKVVNPHGQAIVIARTGAGQISTITEPVSGRSLSFTYGTTGNATGRVTTIADSAGRTVSLAYDANSMLTQITEANGGTTSFTYDAARHLLTESDAQGNLLTSNTYDNTGLGYVTAQIDSRGNSSSYLYSTGGDSFDGFTANVTVTDRNGNLSTYTFDQNHNLISFTSPLGEATASTYDSNGNRLTKTDPLENTTFYTYDAHGNALTVTDPLGDAFVMTYDTRHNLLTSKNPYNATSTFTYDTRNNLLTAADGLAHKVTRTYDANSLLLTQTNPGGGVSTNTYSNGLLTSRKDAAGNTATMAYDAVGNVATQTDPSGATTTYQYGSLRELLEVDDAAGNRGVNTYDWRLRKATMTDPSGAITQYAYDGNNNIVSTTNALNQTTAFTYDNEDRLTLTTDAGGNTASRSYDGDGRVTATTDATGNPTLYTYDGANSLLTVTDGYGITVITNTYDACNQLIRSTDALGRISNRTYDKARLLASTTDPLGRVNTFVRDALGRTTTVDGPLATGTSQTFTTDGKCAALTNADKKSTAFTYDTADRLVKTTTSSGKATSRSYNSRSLIASMTLPNGSNTTFTYDTLGRASTVVDLVGTVTYSYDNNGRVISTVQTASGTQTTIGRQYDLLGRLTQFTDAAGNVLKYAYDNVGNLATLTYPDQKQVTYGYDAAHRLASVTDWANRVTSYQYDGDGRLGKVTRPDGTAETLSRDFEGQLTESSDGTEGIGNVQDISYTLDFGGQITSETVSPVPGVYHPSSALTMTVDADNRLATINSKPAVYDNNGNLTSAVIPGSVVTTLTYDARNRLISAGGLAYTYDAENRRTSVTSSAGATTYVTDPNASLQQVLVKSAPNGTVTRYVYGLGLIGEETNSAFTTYHYDHRGSTTALTDINGNVTHTFSYGPNGEAVGFDPSTAPTQFLYGGCYGVLTDADGVCYMRARYYLPAISRFLNQDTVLGNIETGISLNRFAYANGNPIDNNDPFGLAAQPLNVDAPSRDELATILGVFERLAGEQAFTNGYYNWFTSEVTQNVSGNWRGIVSDASWSKAFDTLNGAGNLLSALDIGVNTYKFYQNPTVGNAVNTALSIASLNPIIGGASLAFNVGQAVGGGLVTGGDYVARQLLGASTVDNFWINLGNTSFFQGVNAVTNSIQNISNIKL